MQLWIRSYAYPWIRPMMYPGASEPVRVRRGWFCMLFARDSDQQRQKHACVGVGEIACWPGFGAGEQRVNDALAELMVDALPPSSLSSSSSSSYLASCTSLMLSHPGLTDCLEQACTQSSASGIHRCVRDAVSIHDWPPELACGIEMALLDRLSRQLQQPMWRVLVEGDLFATTASSHAAESQAAVSVPVNGLVWDVAGARAQVHAGYRTLKIKAEHVHGNDPLRMDERVARVHAQVAQIREAVGSDVVLRLDANGAWTVDEAIAVARAVAPYNVAWIEQPIAARAHDQQGTARDLAHIQRQGGVMIAADESMCDRAAMATLVDADAVGAVVLKPMFLGGLVAAMHAAQHAQRLGVASVITHAMGTAVDRWGAAHVATALATHAAMKGHKNASILACGLSGGYFQRDVDGGPVVQRGMINMPPTAGLVPSEGLSVGLFP